MKKLGIVLFSTAILLTGCAANQKSKTSASSSEAKTIIDGYGEIQRYAQRRQA